MTLPKVMTGWRPGTPGSERQILSSRPRDISRPSKRDTVSVFSYFRGMKNVTISMPDELAHKVRVLAAKADTSMSQYLCQLAAEKAEADDGYTAAKVSYLSRDRGGLRLAGQKLPTRDEIHDRDALR